MEVFIGFIFGIGFGIVITRLYQKRFRKSESVSSGSGAGPIEDNPDDGKERDRM